MKKLYINFKNCFGIENLDDGEFNFENSNVQLIYAKNGTMKTSFAKIFENYQKGTQEKIKDLIFKKPETFSIIGEDDWLEIKGNKEGEDDEIEKVENDNIFVIKSFDESIFSEDAISTLLVDEKNKKEYEAINNLILQDKNSLLVKLNKLSGVKKDEIETQLKEDFNEIDFFKILGEDVSKIGEDYLNIKYKSIFKEEDVLALLTSSDISKNLKDYSDKYNELINDSNIYSKSLFSPAKADSVYSILQKEKFFKADHKIHLNGDADSITEKEFNERLKKENEKILENDDLKKIHKLITKKVSVKKFQDLLEEKPEILKELEPKKLNNFKKTLWLQYFKSLKNEISLFLKSYSDSKDELKRIEDLAKVQEGQWHEAVKKFKRRFDPKYNIYIEDRTSAILGQKNANIIFKFTDKNGEGAENSMDKKTLNGLDVLSTGEKRALYILYILFEVEARKKKGGKMLFIIDDIADSFDYANKYAIVEYLRDLSQEENFYMIILSHNFDFYRTLSSRLSMGRENKFHVRTDAENEVHIEKEEYQNSPFDLWKNVLKERNNYKGNDYDLINAKKHILALIPFVRNLIEYGNKKNINTLSDIEDDFKLLTNLLHDKEKTKEIKIKHLKEIYKEYIDTDDFDESIQDDDVVYDLLIDIADNHITEDNHKLENKIILAISIRLEAENFMKKMIKNSPEEFIFSWKNNRTDESGNKLKFLEFIEESANQTYNLFYGYKQIAEDNNKIKILESVNIMTPENIHINSFMYEPILDMDIVELKELYEDVRDNLK